MSTVIGWFLVMYPDRDVIARTPSLFVFALGKVHLIWRGGEDIETQSMKF